MVLFNDLIEELVEAFVRVVRTSIATYSRAKVLNSRKDASLEADSFGIFIVLVFFPKFFGQMFGKGRFSSC